MSFIDQLFSRLKPKPEKRYHIFQVKCRRCGEIITGRVDVDNDLSVEYEAGGEVFYVRKVLMGDGGRYCYQQIEVGLKFDRERRLLERRIESGGDFIEE